MTEETRRRLAAIGDLCALLPDAAVTRTAVEGVRPAPASRPPLRLDVLDLADTRQRFGWDDPDWLRLDPDRQGVLPYLDTLARDLETTAADGDPLYGIAPVELPAVPGPPTVAGLCGWLADRLEWAATLPQWRELADGIAWMHTRLLAATHAVRDVEERPVPCARCGEPLRRVDGTMPLWECTGCGHSVSVQAVTLTQAARIIGIKSTYTEEEKRKDNLPTLRTLQNWAHRAGVLTPVADGGSHSRKFDLAQIRMRIAEYRVRVGA